MKPAQSMHQLMDQIDEYKQVEEDQQQRKGKAKDWGHTTKDCRTLRDYLEQLVKIGKLKQFLHTGAYPPGVMYIVKPHAEDSIPESKQGRMEVRPAFSFSDENKIGTYQPHDNALVVTLQIGGYDVRRVLVDQGSGVEVMYPYLYKGLKLKPKDLVSYDSPLVGFDGKTVIPKGQIRLSIQVGSKVVEVDFIVVNVYSPYTAIMART
ncbi:uncharacterized protein LOC126704987 [Quercus robur]|uniref:uncharacterized protein LOC126704987 n=1 Tax=Quercus robur TaxID=38942 RepID=UPI0021615E80|nr:uncharacterized protein LOC126704987 [Quercus robur]